MNWIGFDLLHFERLIENYRTSDPGRGRGRGLILKNTKTAGAVIDHGENRDNFFDSMSRFLIRGPAVPRSRSRSSPTTALRGLGQAVISYIIKLKLY